MWILGTAKADGMVFVAPALVTLALAPLFGAATIPATILAFISFAVLDAGHAYVTLYRTWFGHRMCTGKAPWSFLLIPLILFILVVLWQVLGAHLLWQVVFYATNVHYMRQFYGFLRWYGHLNRRSCPNSEILFWVLVGVPFFILHVRPEILDGQSQGFLGFFMPSFDLYLLAVVFYACMLIFWLGFEVWLWRRGIREPNRILALLVPALLYGLTAFFATTTAQVAGPLAAVHGFTYMGATIKVVRAAEPPGNWLYRHALLAVVGLALAVGAVVSGAEVVMRVLALPLVNEVFVTIYLTTLFSHYAWDSLLWRRSDPDFRQVLAATPTCGQP